MCSDVLAVNRCSFRRFLDFLPSYRASLLLDGTVVPGLEILLRVYRAPGSLRRIFCACTHRLSHVPGFPAGIQDACSVVHDACPVIRDARASCADFFAVVRPACAIVRDFFAIAAGVRLI